MITHFNFPIKTNYSFKIIYPHTILAFIICYRIQTNKSKQIHRINLLLIHQIQNTKKSQEGVKLENMKRKKNNYNILS